MITATELSRQIPPGALWVFGYGSLMWRPGFAFTARRNARIYGYHRGLYVWSWYHRGLPERPGLVMGLDNGGSCLGRAYRVAPKQRVCVIDYLLDRELVTPAYRPKLVLAHLDNGRQVPALTFIVNRQHDQYTGRLDLATMVETVRHAHGHSGANDHYVMETATALEDLGIARSPLHAVLNAL